MAHRALAQKIGSLGHKWLLAQVEKHSDWLSRDLGEDFGVDMEFELAIPQVQGEILKVQVKSSANVFRKDGKVQFQIDRKYIEYASACRYPVILVLVDVEAENAWYLWLQDWLLSCRKLESPLRGTQETWTEWVPERQTLLFGLDGELKSIAKWEGQTQLVLSLLDALRSAVAILDREAVEALTKIIVESSTQLGDAPLNVLIDKAIALGNRMRGTTEGNEIADQLFSLVRKFGDRVSIATISALVLRGDSYSRVGLSALEILYDEFPNHIKSLGLLRLFKKEPGVGLYCAFREANPGKCSLDIPPGFTYGGLKFMPSHRFLDNYINRGPSAILDHLVLEKDA